MEKLFGPEGITGTAITELTCEIAMQTGRALVLALENKLSHKVTVLIGKDTRLSSDILENALIAGICSAGGDVKKLGVVPIGAVAFLTHEKNADAGIMISTPAAGFEYNGIVLFSSAGYRISEDIEDEIENAVLRHPETIKIRSHESVGTATYYKDGEWDYIRHVIKLEDFDYTGLRVVIDCANGSASETAEKLYTALGAKCFLVNNKPDGKNINSQCGIKFANNLTKVMKSKRADVGLVFDGSASRCFAIDENGVVVDGDDIMTIIAMHLKKDGRLKKDTVVVTDLTNLGFRRFAKNNNIIVSNSRSTERGIIEKEMDGDYSIGGEKNGRIILNGMSTTADALITGLELLSALKSSGKRMSLLAGAMVKYPQVMINVAIRPECKELWKNDPVITDFIEQKQNELGEEGRILVREIGHEPLIRVMVEGKSFEAINQCAKEIHDKITEQTRPNVLHVNAEAE